jgi:GGDEF domain-containing protein
VRGLALRRLPALALLLFAAVAGAEEAASFKAEQLPVSLAGQWLFRVGHDPAWSSPFRERRSWQAIAVPAAWERQGHQGYSGHAWYFLRVFISSSLAGEELGLDLGFVGDADEVFLNGQSVGATGKFPPRFEVATLSRRLYRMPQESIRIGEYNEIAVHVFKGGRHGGLLGPAPRLDRFPRLLAQQVLRDIVVVVIATLLGGIALFHLLLFAGRREGSEHPLFAGFLLLVAAHVLTHTAWGPALLLGHGVAFRLHVATLLGAIVVFVACIFGLLRQSVPTALVALQTVLVLGAAFALAWRDTGDLYLWVYAAEAAILISGLATVGRLWRWSTENHKLGLALFATLAALAAAVLFDISQDVALIGPVSPNLPNTLSTLFVLPVAGVFSAVLFDRWIAQHWGEPTDRATGLIPRERFIRRLGGEVERSRKAETPLTVALLRLSFESPGGDSNEHAGTGMAAAILRRSLRHIDSLGSHEPGSFAILLVDTEERAALVTLERLRRAIVDAVPRGHLRPVVTGAVAEYRPTRHHSAGELLTAAEAALYAALSEGGDCTAAAP